MSKRHLLIAIEGIDGVGKTTIAQKLTVTVEGVCVKMPVGRLLKKLALLAEKAGNQELEALIYFVLAAISGFYLRFKLRRKNLVCDKYILVTVVDQMVLGSRVSRFLGRFRYLIVPKPDFTFCLQVNNKEALLARLRGRSKMDHNDGQLLPLWREIQNLYSTFPEVVPVDTTQLSAEEIAVQLKQQIFSLKQLN